MSNTNKYFADLLKVCSVLPVFAVMPAMANTPERQTFTSGEKVTITNQSLSGHTETANWAGGLFLVSGGSELTIQGGSYTNNANNTVLYSDPEQTIVSARGAGGVVGQGNGVVKVTDYNDVRAQFIGNSALAAGGALWLGRQAEIINTDFIGNRVLGVEDDMGVSIDGGGALFLGASSTTVIDDVLFKSNSSAVEGGAISMRSATQGNNSQAKLDIFDSEFTDNHADTNGGAIYSTFYDSKTVKDSVYIYDTDFTLNSANNGGAIYTEGVADLGGGLASMKIVDADFVSNSANSQGGAIYAGGNMTLQDVEFVENSAVEGGAIFVNAENKEEKQVINITDALFQGNHADADVGGAISLRRGELNIDNATFKGNTAKFSGAIFSYSSGNTLNITNSLFEANNALGAGAIQAMYTTNISDTVFKNNLATQSEDGGGALFVGAVGKAMLERVTFENNHADQRGGAISTRSADLGDNTNAKLDVLNSVFTRNTAGTTGGAFDNYMYSSVADVTAVYFENVEFNTNEAMLGGAVYNHGAADLGGNTASTHINGATFTGNIATDAGGAIYNEVDGALMLSGNNTFVGNTANGVANDIYNDGVLTVVSGTTSFDGGITGTGTLDIKSDAILNMNYASIEQSAITLDGTLKASLLNASDELDITGTVSGDGRMELNVGAAGVYDLSDFEKYIDNDSFGKTYNVAIKEGVATLTAKQATELAKETGITGGAAGAVSALASASDARLQKVSLAIQEALNSGDTALVEKEMAKVNPDSKPVGHSVAASVQGQVASVAAGRMSAVGGGAMGRSGGDVTSAGFWAQGLINKSKMNGAFEGHTTGFALGGDALFDDVLTLGGGFAVNNTEIEADGRDTNVESNSVFAYAQYKPAEWFVNATISYTISDYTDNARMLGGVVINNQYDAEAFGIQAMAGYDFASGVTPEFGLRYLHVAQEEHVDGLNRVIREVNSDMLTGIAGLNYAFAIESDTEVKFSPSLRAAMTYDIVTPEAVATIVVPGASAYYVDVDSLSRFGGEFGIGLTAEYRGFEFSLNYELDLHKDYTSQTGLFKFRYDF